ncbi:hypothetical protein KW786_03775, partial [Candidatus Parcubacteria bacterium]|nr:hypothetical protein [Candidatus Parcubacteria bacterium]
MVVALNAICLFGVCSQADAKIFIKPFDATGVRSSSDLTVPCPSGQVMKSSGAGVWSCGDDSTATGTTIFPMVSEDGSQVVSADTFNFTTGLKAAAVGTKVTISGDMATTTTPGIASFDSASFSVGPFGGVVLSAVSVAKGGTGLTSVS